MKFAKKYPYLFRLDELELHAPTGPHDGALTRHKNSNISGDPKLILF